MASDALIEPASGSSRSDRTRAAVLTVVFLGVLLATAVVDSFWPAPEIQLVGQEALEASRARRQREIRTGAAAKWVEKELELRSRVRRSLAPWWTAALLEYAQVGVSELIVGREQWLFLRRRAMPPTEPPAEVFTTGLHALVAAKRRLAAGGTSLVLVPVPRKAAACSSLLPDGIPFRPELERELPRLMANLGLEHVDLMEAWRDLDPREIYLSHDSHWAVGGQIAAARACIRARPDIVGGEFEASIVLHDSPAPIAGNLEFTGVLRNHPAYRMVAPDPAQVARLSPPSLVNRFRTFDGTSDVALVGSSFSNDFDFPLLLFGLAQRDIFKRTYRALPFGEALARCFGDLRNQRDPRIVFFEFPLHQFFDIPGGRNTSELGIGNFFLHAKLPEVSELPGAACNVFSNHPHGLRLRLAPGLACSSGTGIVSLRLRASGAGGSRWRMRTSDFTFDFRWPDDTDELVLPILEGLAPQGMFELSGLDEPARRVELSSAVVTDLDLERGVSGEARTASDGALVFDFDDAAIGSGSGVAVQLAGARGAVAQVDVECVFADGSTRAYSCEAAGDSLHVVDLCGMEGRALQEVRVRAQPAVGSAILAPPHAALAR